MHVGSGPAHGLRVVVADGNALARRGLTSVLAAAGALVVAEADDTDAALGAVAVHDPDVLMVNLALARGAGRGHVVAVARDRWPDLGIVALSDDDSGPGLLSALELGASAHVAKTAQPATFVSAAVQAAAAPGAFLANDLTAARRQARARGPQLTVREAEVLQLAAEGLTVRGISARLFVSEATTRSHLAGIYRKLGVTSRSQAVLTAERLGMLT